MSKEFQNEVANLKTLSSFIPFSHQLKFHSSIFSKSESDTELESMFEQQHFIDSQGNSTFGGRDSKSWLTGEDNSSPSDRREQPLLGNSGTVNGNVDRLLFNDLVEIVPLVQSLIDRKATSSFTRRGSMIYTKKPARESLSKKGTDPKGRNVAQSLPPKKKKDSVDKDQGKNATSNQDGDNFSIFSSRGLSSEKENEDLVSLREQVEDLQKKIQEKDELLKSAESSKDQIFAVQVKLDELKRQAAEKDSQIKSTQLQLSDTKIKLADKQAAVEKLQWEAMTATKKAEKLQEELDSVQGEISSFVQLFAGLGKNDPNTCIEEDYDIKPYQFDHIPYIDDMDERTMQKMEEAREAYMEAIAAAKQKQDEESFTAAVNARLHLQSFVFASNV